MSKRLIPKPRRFAIYEKIDGLSVQTWRVAADNATEARIVASRIGCKVTLVKEIIEVKP